MKRDVKMIKQQKMKTAWSGNDQQIELELAVIHFRDEKGIFFSFLPALDITGYGKTAREAAQSLKIVLHEYLDTTTRNHTLLKDLG